jgi:aryl-alcohol dehydrogenase-like predicted oxidoreductase
MVPIEESAAAMQSLLDQGKIRAIGVSNFSAAEIERFRRVAGLHVVQPPYNLFEREIEAELLPYCRQSGRATLRHGALCRGLLPGTLPEDAQFQGDDLRLTDPKFQMPRFAQYLTAVRHLEEFAMVNYGQHVIHLAVRWILDQGSTTALWEHVIPANCNRPMRFSWSLDTAAKAEIERSCESRSLIRSALNSWHHRRDPKLRSCKSAQ